MAKQTFSSGQILTAAQVNSLQANDYNWTVTAKTASYILTATDVGTRITMSNAAATTITINTATMAAGDVVYLLNIGAGVCTVTAGAGTTVVSAGALNLGTNAGGYLFALSSTSFYFIADGVRPPSPATTLPASPTDGQQAILVDSVSAPTYRWQFQYNASSANSSKWEFIGGSPALVGITTAEAANSATYGDLATVGPSFTIPNAGDYDVVIEAEVGAGAAVSAFMSYSVGAAAAIDGDSAQITIDGAGGGRDYMRRTQRRTGMAASTALVVKYRNASGVSTTWSKRYLIVQPVRVA